MIDFPQADCYVYATMKSGNVVEYIDRQKILCAVVQDIKRQRLRLLTENNREVNLSVGRLSHHCDLEIDLSQGRDKTVEQLRLIARRRRDLTDRIDIRELWEVLNTEQEWIDLETMTSFCFNGGFTSDHQSAVVRAFFHNRLYFKFNQDRFFPRSEQQVQLTVTRREEQARRDRLIENGAAWLYSVSASENCRSRFTSSPEASEYIEILKSCYLYGKDSPRYDIGNAMLKRAGIDVESGLFQILVKLGIFDADENIELLRFETSIAFSDAALDEARQLLAIPADFSACRDRKDFSALPLITIDGQATLDFDDALSIQDSGDHYTLGIHIADVGQLIGKDSIIDREAAARGSSIYMPDQRIPMLPPDLAEGLCSLIAGELRPAISTLVKISTAGEILGYEVALSTINVRHQLSYYDANQMVEENHGLAALCNIAKAFRARRLADGAVQISLPEIHVWLNEDNDACVSRINRESPSRMMVSEIMIMANWMMARFLAENQIPAVYRSQPEAKDRLYRGDEGSLFQNLMQRKLLNRFALGSSPERHCGLGLETYVTATSPIRKYFDLITQRQIRSIFGLEKPYSREEIDHIIQSLEITMGQVSRLQWLRNRYWLFKYLEKRIGTKEEALVLFKRRNSYQILLTEYMLECGLPASAGIRLKPEDMIQVTIQHVNARKDLISVFMG